MFDFVHLNLILYILTMSVSEPESDLSRKYFWCCAFASKYALAVSMFVSLEYSMVSYFGGSSTS